MKSRPLCLTKLILTLYFAICSPVVLAEIAVIDDAGKTVRLERYAQRIVALSPHITENLFAAGLGTRIVATVAHADYPAQAKALPRIGGYNSLNLEALIQLQPDLIITWGSGISYESQAKLHALGIPIYISEPETIEGIQENIEDFALLGGLTQNNVPVLGTFTQVLAKYPKRDATATVFYQIWNEPIQTLNGVHIANDVFSRCGLYNAFATSHSVAPTLSVESVITASPDVIIASGLGNERPPWLDRWTKYSSISAVKSGALYALNPDLLQRPTPRILDGLTQICSWSSQLRASNPNVH